MRLLLSLSVVFWGGFAIMVLEIVGARYLAPDFGSSFHVWVSQIGVVLGALAAGYVAGGMLGDRFQRPFILAVMLIPAGLFTWSIPAFAPGLVDWIVERHPLEQPIPPVWQKFDPVLGSSLVFMLPCFVLATISPCMIRLASRRLQQVGRISGLIFALSTLGSIAGVFVSGYVLVDHWGSAAIFRGTGVLTLLLGLGCVALDRVWAARPENLDTP